jgi:hypothetical protein
MSLDVRLPSLMFILRSFLAVWKRFPATMLASVVASGALIQMINDGGDSANELFMVALLGLPVFTGITAFCESRNWVQARHYSFLAAGALLLTMYFRFLSAQESMIETVELPRYMLLLLTAHLAVSFGPYIGQFSVRDFWEYNRELFASFVTGSVFSFIIWIGLSAAILAVNELFNLHIKEEVYGHLFAVVSGVFTTSFFLHHFPSKYQFEQDEMSYHTLFKNLCKYILIPIVALYFIILYVYGGKILFTWSLPKGWVGSLVLGFSIAGIFTYLLNYMLPKHDDSPVVQQYHRWFWPVLLPLVLLLLVAIGRRIGDYGVTESRYVVAHAGVWLMLACLYFVVSKTDNIKFIPISLSLFALVASVGPFSMLNVSTRSQIGELQELLEKNKRWADGKVKQSLVAVSSDDAERMNSILRYLDRREVLDQLDSWFDVPVSELPEVGRVSRLTANILASMGVDQKEIAENSTVYVSPNAEVRSGNIRGFNTYYSISIFPAALAPARGKYFALGADKKSIVWRERRGTRYDNLESFDLTEAINSWVEGSESGTYYLPKGKELLDYKGERAEMRLFIQDASLDVRGDSVTISRLNGLLFLKDKHNN